MGFRNMIDEWASTCLRLAISIGRMLAGGRDIEEDMMRLIHAGHSPRSVILIRLLVGAVFLAEGIQKFLFPAALGIGRFAKIGLPASGFLAPFVGVVEVTCGSFLIIGLLTRWAAVPLLIDMTVAIATTKIPMLHTQGFWAMVHEARTDWCMFLGALFLLIAGPGVWSIDARITSDR
jgi:putative oxidoreductase